MTRRAGRRLDLGALSVETYVATDRALLDCREQGLIPDTLTFLHFDRPAALVGFHQSIPQELRLEHCERRQLPVQRRITGGGALYVDDGVLGWELYLDRSVLGTAQFGEVAGRLCTLAAEGLSELGVDARFRPRNDIEVNGRKICGTGGVYEGNALLYHGSVLLDFDVERMVEILRIPAEKWRDKAVADARERVTSLRALLGSRPALADVQAALTRAFARGLGIEFSDAALTPCEIECREQARVEIAGREWIAQHERPAFRAPILEATHRCAGGLLRVALLVDSEKGRIKQAWFTGDFLVHPRRLVPDLEAALRDTAIDDRRRTIERFFNGYPVEMLKLSRDDFGDAIDAALATSQKAAQASGQGA